MSDKVPNIVHFKNQYKVIVQEIVRGRKLAGQSQEQMADWIGVDRRKIITMEGLKKVELETLLKCADKLSIDIELRFLVN